MMENIERIHYFRDDQIPEIMHFRAIQKRFNPKDTKHGIVDVDGPNLVILDKESKYYLICHHHINVYGSSTEKNGIHH